MDVWHVYKFVDDYLVVEKTFTCFDKLVDWIVSDCGDDLNGGFVGEDVLGDKFIRFVCGDVVYEVWGGSEAAFKVLLAIS